MATTGQKYPTYADDVMESPWSDNAWGGSSQNIFADDGTAAEVSAPTYDTGDQTYVLKAFTFDFSEIPDGSTIDGVICRVNAWYANGAASLDLCQLLSTSRSKVGTNHCSTPIALTTNNATIITEGSSTDLWGNSLTAAWVKDSDFGVALGCIATGDNADVFIDYVTLEIYYTAPAGGVDVTPGAATCIASSSNPTPVLGSLSVVVGSASTIALAPTPEVILGSLVATPLAASSIAATIAPTVDTSGGATIVTPAAATAITITEPPAVTLASITVAPSSSSAISLGQDPSIVLGSLAIAPSASVAYASSIAPTVEITLPDVVVTPTAAQTICTITDATVILGSITYTPSLTSAIMQTAAPAVRLGSITYAPTAATVIASSLAPTVITGVDLFFTIYFIAYITRKAYFTNYITRKAYFTSYITRKAYFDVHASGS